MDNITGNLIGHTLRRSRDDIKQFLDVIQIEGNYSVELNITGLVDSRDQKGSLTEKRKLGLVHGLKAHEGTQHNA